MPRQRRSLHNLRHAAASRVTLAAAPSAPSIEDQCEAVVARLKEITGLDGEHESDGEAERVDVRALEHLPDPTGWGGRAIVPWGHPHSGGMLSRQIASVRAGRTGWYLQYAGTLYDTIRDAFVAARLNKPVSAPWTMARQVHTCGCLTIAEARHVAIEGSIDVDGQLELLRGVLKHVALAAPDIDLDTLSTDLFAGQRVLAEHYLWRLETDGFVDHAHDELQSSLMLTAEGCSTLLMLELTKPGGNEDVMSPKALAEVPAAPTPAREQHDLMDGRGSQIDVPRFLIFQDRQNPPRQ